MGRWQAGPPATDQVKPDSTRHRAAIATILVAAASTLPVALAPATANASSPRGALEQVRTAFAYGAGSAAAVDLELSEALRDLASGLQRLERSERREARSYLARPSGPSGDVSPAQRYPGGQEAAASPACAEQVCVHWTDRGEHAPPPLDANGVADVDGIPDYVEAALNAVRKSVAVQHGRLGWRRAKKDGGRGEPVGAGTRNRADIYLLELGREIAGFTAVDASGKGRRRTGWVAVDNDFSEQPGSRLTLLQVTIAHEYNHLLQYAYDVDQQPWIYESVATWIEDQVFPSANLYLGFVKQFARSPRSPLDAEATMYGAATLHQFIAHRGGSKLVRRIWEKARKFNGPDRSYRALQAGLRHGGLGAAPTFARFAAVSAAWEDHPAFPDAALLPAVRRTGAVRQGRGQRRTRLSRMSYAITPIKKLRSPGRLRVRVRGPKKVQGYAALVSHRRGGGAGVDRIRKLRRGSRTLRLNHPEGVDRVEVVVIDTDTRLDRDPRFIYRGDARRFTIKAR